MIEFQNISKSFNGRKALDGITFKIKQNSIHAFIGENGAGKSTACKILYGMHEADSGQLLFKGKPFSFRNSVRARSAGFGMVHQHFMLAAEVEAWKHMWLELSANSNLLELLARPLNEKKIIDQLEAIAHRFNYIIPWSKKISSLDVATQQKIEILKMFSAKPKVILFDEPTAILSPPDAEDLLKQMRTLRDEGHTIVLVTHKMKEVFAVADTVTVFRNGKSITTEAVSNCTPDYLTEKMVGEIIHPISRSGRKLPTGNPVLKFSEYSIGPKTDDKSKTRKLLNKISLDVKKCEIVGIAGIEGHGQRELADSIMSPWKFKGRRFGNLDIKEFSVFGLSSEEIRNLGVSYIPEDRTKDASLSKMSALENFFLGHQNRSDFVGKKKTFINWKNVKLAFKKQTRTLGLKPPTSRNEFNSYSGGNQQKIIVGRELLDEPDFLLAVNPTRGVDIQTTHQIHKQILGLKQSGSSILLISSDLDELITLSDRIFVIFNGELVGQLHDYDFNERLIGKLMTTGES